MGQAVGGMIAPGVIGTNVGSLAGQGIGAVIDRITGQGDYTIKSNTLIKAAPVPSFGKGCIRVKHREMIQNIVSSTLFEVSSTDINPGLSVSFPWLAQIAQNFEMYKFHGLIFEYVSTSGDALTGTNTALGKVIMATDYNVLDSVYENEQQMYATEFSNSGKPATNLIHAVECAPPENPLKLYYIRTGNPPAGSDQRFYDLGRFQLATSGSQAVGTAIGELWVSYDVSLCKPSLQATDAAAGQLAGHARLISYAGSTGPFRANNNMLMYSGSNIVFTNSTTNAVTLDAKITSQRLLCVFTWGQNSGPPPNLALNFNVNNGSVQAFWENGIVGQYNLPTSAASGVVHYGCVVIVQADAPGPEQVQISFDNAQSYGTVTAFDLVVTQIPDTLGPLF